MWLFDLTFSGNYIDDEIRIQIESLIEAHGWTIQNKKTGSCERAMRST
jgi:hypothetical protein